MKYVRCENPGILLLGEKEYPVPSIGDILLKVKAVGICGTDVHAYQGNQPFLIIPGYLATSWLVKYSIRETQRHA